MTQITVTDKAGTSGSITVDQDAVAEAIRGWYPDAPADVTDAIDQLQVALDRGEDVTALAAYLAIEISTPTDYGTLTDYVTGEAIRPATEAERDASRAAGETGAFTVDRDGDICPADADHQVYGPIRTVFVAE